MMRVSFALCPTELAWALLFGANPFAPAVADSHHGDAEVVPALPDGRVRHCRGCIYRRVPRGCCSVSFTAGFSTQNGDGQRELGPVVDRVWLQEDQYVSYSPFIVYRRAEHVRLLGWKTGRGDACVG